MPRSHSAFSLLVLLFLFLPYTLSIRTLLLEVFCFRPHIYPGATQQQFSLCTPQCRDFSFHHAEPLGICATTSDRPNLPSRLKFNFSDESDLILQISAYTVLRDAILVIRKPTVQVTFNLTNAKPWPEFGHQLPQSHELKTKAWKISANLSIRAAWAYQGSLETTTFTAIHPTTTAVVVAISRPLWAILAACFGLISLFCVVVLLTLCIRRRKKKQKRGVDLHTPMQRVTTPGDVNTRYDYSRVQRTTELSGINPYDLRESHMPDEIYDDLEYDNIMYENQDRSNVEEPVAVLYEDPGTVYSMERQSSWDNSAYGKPPIPPVHPRFGSKTERYARNLHDVRGSWDLMTIFQPKKYTMHLIPNLRSMAEQQKTCMNLGGRLATIHSDDDVQAIKRMKTPNDAYVGLTDFKKEGEFVWLGNLKMTDKQKESFWDKGEPNNFEGNEQCVTIKKRNPGKGSLNMNDINCDNRLPAICMIDPSAVTSGDKFQGAAFSSPLVLGGLRIVVEKAQQLKVYGALDKAPSVGKTLALILIRRNSSSDTLCGHPTPFVQLYKQFVKNVTTDVNKEGRFLLFARFNANTDWMNYAAVLREVSDTPRELACAEFKEYAELDWYKKMSDISARASMGVYKEGTENEK